MTLVSAMHDSSMGRKAQKTARTDGNTDGLRRTPNRLCTDDGPECAIHSVRKTDLNVAGKSVEVGFAEITTESLKIAQGALSQNASYRLSIGNIQFFPFDLFLVDRRQLG
jgi:hypothetical protein